MNREQAKQYATYAYCAVCLVYAAYLLAPAVGGVAGQYALVAHAGPTSSMEPTFDEGDVLVVANDSVDEGDIVAFHPNGDRGQLYLHRAVTHVEEGENWYKDVDPQYTDYQSCEKSPACPARNAGWITRGDNETVYDQDRGMTRPVKDGWIRGTSWFILDR